MGPRIAVSACLLGQRVRYDGGHKHCRAVVEIFSGAELVAVCPEHELGLATPRPPMHLRARDGEARLVVIGSGRDLSAEMRGFASRRERELGPLDGYIFKSRSPSCAVASAPLIAAGAGAERLVDGLFAAELMARRSGLAVIEETGLREPRLARHFVRRVFTAARVRHLLERRWSPKELLELFADHELLLFSHDPAGTRELGAILARAGVRDPAELAVEVGGRIAAITAQPPTVGREVDTLLHVLGYFAMLGGERRRDLHQRITALPAAGPDELEALRRELEELAEHHGVEYLQRQHYFVIDPDERAALKAVDAALHGFVESG